MSRQSAFIEQLKDLKRSCDALIEEIETGGLPYGEYSGEEPEEPPVEDPPGEEGPPAEEPPVEEPPAEEPPAEPDPDPAPDPTPPPATPNPPATNDDLVDGLRDGRTPCGARTPVAGMKVAGRDAMPAGIIVTPELVIFDSFTGDLDDDDGWDFGDRQVVIKSRFGAFNNWHSKDMIARLTGNKGNTPGIWIQSGGFDIMERATHLDGRAPMILKQDQGAIAGEITRCDLRGMAQDAIKVGGSCLIHENLIADAKFRGGSPHADVLTVMSAEGDVVFRNNFVDWVYLDQSGAVMADQSGINNWFRIEAYPAYSGRYDDVIIEGNKLRHANPTSFAMQVTSKNSPVWDGSIKVRNNRMDKAGGNRKILYAASSRISEWANNVDFAGNDIPYSAT